MVKIAFLKTVQIHARMAIVKIVHVVGLVFSVGLCVQDMHSDRQRASLVRRARDLEAEKATLQLAISEMNHEHKARAKSEESLKQRLKTMVGTRSWSVTLIHAYKIDINCIINIGMQVDLLANFPTLLHMPTKAYPLA